MVFLTFSFFFMHVLFSSYMFVSGFLSSTFYPETFFCVCNQIKNPRNGGKTIIVAEFSATPTPGYFRYILLSPVAVPRFSKESNPYRGDENSKSNQ